MSSNYLLQIQRNLNTIDLNDSIIAVLNSVKLNNYNIINCLSLKIGIDFGPLRLPQVNPDKACEEGLAKLLPPIGVNVTNEF